ncbi:MAG: galactose-1-phosphate uridylyltransferase, partial [Candidatus Omnitrophica bacterium]|nr:galactose-1-phosphate uridylyltransferase [Candidatus Omnitrophota bacterium]
LLNTEVENFLSMYCRRALDLVRDKRFKYIMVFKNFGAAAGASLEHPHTQMIALPMIPKSVLEEIKGAHDYYQFRERCIFCDIIRQEKEEKERIVLENDYFVCFAPYASRFPFELWIIPKKHNEFFCHMPAKEIPALASILRETIARLKVIFPHLSYNFIVHSGPVNTDVETEGYHWHIEFMPKLTRVAGFEWGSGFYLVSTPPELAAKYLKEAKTTISK